MSESKYDRIGLNYNSTRIADPYIGDRLYELLQPVKNKVYLDIGCGTGNYTISLAERGLSLVGIDPSELMLAKANGRNENVQWLAGSAEQIPIDDNVIDGAMATLTLHHWGNLDIGFEEIARVLKPNTPFVIFSSTPEQMKGYWLNHYFPKMLEASILQMPSLDRIKAAATKTGFIIEELEKYFIQPDLQDHFLYVGKHHPEQYFQEEIRNGISSFTALANSEEVNEGLNRLRNDIDSNKFEKIKSEYQNELGDYLFIRMRKQSK